MIWQFSKLGVPAGRRSKRGGEQARRRHAIAAARGFTLFELLIALVVAALVMTVIVPSVRNRSGRVDLASVAHDVAESVRNTRAMAIDANRRQEFVIDVDRRIYGPLHAVPMHRLQPDIRISLATTAGSLIGPSVGGIRFYPDGSSSGGTIVLADGGLRYELLINWLDGGVVIHETADLR
jgi:general secretion pathway protein H